MLTHPSGRPHHEQFDGRFWNAFTEAEAFAWAQDIAALGFVEFVETEGAPDLKAGEFWVEAKTIEESEAERQETERLVKDSGGMLFRGPIRLVPPDEGLIGKLDRQANDAVKKWRRQSSGRLITFFDLRTIDFGISRDQALADVANWARRKAHADGTSIVVCFNHRWRAPFVVEGL
ncbi:MAG: hypothetical protein C4558_05515 [Dehalococcoidia bacterium]|nr:MAG: hypothetical protein C4558_05515 [Dehalococcoidia bacterium]